MFELYTKTVVDKKLFLMVSFLIFISIVFSLSLTQYMVLSLDYKYFHFFIRQFLYGIFSIYLMWLISRLDPDIWVKRIGFFVFFISFMFMIIMPYMPSNIVPSVGGAKRWIRVFGYSLSPIEFFKVGFVYFLAWSFSRKLKQGNNISMKDEIVLVAPYFAIFLLIVYFVAVLQNELGQVIILGCVFAIMALFAGISFRLFTLSMVGISVFFLIAILTSPYRILRIKVWWANAQYIFLSIFPDSFAKSLFISGLPESYQTSHSLSAIKNGGLFGQGIGNGFLKLGFLSEVHTDFVLAGITEEIGVIGLCFILAIFFFILHRIFKIANRSDNNVFYLFSLGIGFMLALSLFMNAYGITSVIPIKGISVPFISYGGSSLLSSCIAIGIILMISKRCYK